MADGSCGNQVHWGALSIVAINAMMGSSLFRMFAPRVEMLATNAGLRWLFHGDITIKHEGFCQAKN